MPVVIGPYTFVDYEKKTFERGKSLFERIILGFSLCSHLLIIWISGKAIIKVLPPIEPKDFPEDVQALADKTAKIMQEEFDKLSAAQAEKPPPSRNKTVWTFNPVASSTGSSS